VSDPGGDRWQNSVINNGVFHMASAAPHGNVFPADHATKVAKLLSSADPRVIARYDAHQAKADTWRGLSRERVSELQKVTTKIQRIKSDRDRFQIELQRFAKAEFVTAEDGTKTLHPSLKNYDDQLSVAEKRRQQLTTMQVGTHQFDDITSFLESWPDGRPLKWDSDIPELPDGDLVAIGNVERKKLSDLIAKYDRTYSLPPDPATVDQRITDFVKLRAKKIELGGLVRGESTDSNNRRSLRVVNPSPTIPTFQVVYGMDSNVPDTLGILCWLQPQIVADALRAQYVEGDSMSPAEKTKIIPLMERQIWRQRCLVEVIACGIEAQGGTFNRPRFTPAECLLGVAPISYALDAQDF
jgi:hypothetical protein